jgi:predicted ATPase
MELIVERVPDTAVLALITCRPEFDAPWIGRPRVTSMVLNRLERTDCADMIERVWGMENLSRDICDRIAAQTDGIPLFVEELTKSVLESATVSPKPGATLAVPATLQDSLEARLDRLGQAKEVAQIGSVIGREFDYDLLSRIIELDEAELNAALVELVDSGLASVRGAPSSPTYIFKHALLRDTAYASMLRGRRAEIHSAVANALDTSFPDKASTEPELLAYHYTEAGLVERAIDYWGRAGRWAAERSADVEAIVHFDKALELLATQPEGPERDLHEIQLHIAQRAPIIAVKGWAAMELERANARALTLCDRVGDVPEIFSVLYGGWVLLHTSGRITESQVWAKEIVRRAEAQEEVVPKVLGHRVLGTSLLMEGNSGGAEKYLARAWNLFGETIDEWDSFRFGSGKVAISNYRSLALWYGGLPEQAFFYAHESLTQVGELQHVNTVGHVYYHYAWLCSLASRFDDVDEYGARIIEFAERNNLEFWSIVGELLRSWASIETALGEDQITRFERSLAEYEATQMGLMAPRLNGVMATAYGKAGHADRGISIINEQLAAIEQKGQRVDQAELYRLWGELEILRGASSDAEARLLQALHVARSQSAKSWELRAATSLARLWRSLGQITEAREVLAPVYGWFTEGFDTSDLKEAKALLDELS